jgi:kynurenine formamidase
MFNIDDMVTALQSQQVQIIDLTAPLDADTPILALPAPFANTIPFRLEEISHYDDRGPAWFWNNIHTGEHTGTHLDAPNHWITGRTKSDVSQFPLSNMLAPGAVLDVASQAAANPDFLIEVSHIEAWQKDHGPLPNGCWLLCRTGWAERSRSQEKFLNADANGPHTPGFSVQCAEWLATEAPIIGVGVETVGTDAGAAHSFDPPFPCHQFLLGAGKFGLTQLQNLDKLPPVGALVITTPLPILGGSGSPARVLALVDNHS